MFDLSCKCCRKGRTVKTVAILPVKSFARAKQRLGPVLDLDQRTALARAMVLDTLDALSVAQLQTIVVTSEPALQGLHTATVLPDPRESGQSAAAVIGIRSAREAERALLVPGDCPALDPRELQTLLDSETQVVIAPDRHGTGTNALLLTPPTIIVPAFGAGSFSRHQAAAQAAGASCEVVRVPSLQHDVDTVEDLQALRSLLEERAQAAPRTREALRSALRAA